MKTTKFFALLCVIMLSFSCNQNEPSSSGSSSSNNGDNSGDGTAKTTEQIVKENVSVIVNYAQYSWWVSISPYLDGKLNTSNIKYGIECGYGNYNWQQYAEGSGTHYSLRASVFIDGSGSPYANEGFYWNSYLALQKNYNMNSDERNLWNNIIQIYNQKENAAKSQYSGRVFVEVSGVRYYIKYFGNTSNNNNGNNGGNNGGGSGTTQGITSLYLYDYTEWPTKIKVMYKYESDLSVTSAKIYYGEYSASSSVSATVSSSMITATISGLKKNTVYFVKASATTSKGTVYSSESRVMTAIE